MININGNKYDPYIGGDILFKVTKGSEIIWERNTSCTSITITNKQETISSTEEYTVAVEVKPSYTTDTVTYSSSDETVATVDATGKVTILKDGDCTITATCGEKSDSFTFTAALVVPCTAVSIDNAPEKMTVNTTTGLTCTLTPSNTTDTLVYSSSDETIATVDSATGVVSALTEGSVTITATCGSASDSCTFNVEAVQLKIYYGTLNGPQLMASSITADNIVALNEKGWATPAVGDTEARTKETMGVLSSSTVDETEITGITTVVSQPYNVDSYTSGEDWDANYFEIMPDDEYEEYVNTYYGLLVMIVPSSMSYTMKYDGSITASLTKAYDITIDGTQYSIYYEPYDVSTEAQVYVWYPYCDENKRLITQTGLSITKNS